MAILPPQPNCSLDGKRIRIRPLRFADLPEIAAWEPFTDPLLHSYNLWFDSPAVWRRWLQGRLQHRWVYAIRNQAQILIGHMSLRHVDHPNTSRLGITIGASFMGNGYGVDTMQTFLDYYFGDLGFWEMRLDVSGANFNARRLYKRVGFGKLYEFWLSASVMGKWNEVRDKDRLRHFHRGKERFYEMRLTAKEWWRVRASLE